MNSKRHIFNFLRPIILTFFPMVEEIVKNPKGFGKCINKISMWYQNFQDCKSIHVMLFGSKME